MISSQLLYQDSKIAMWNGSTTWMELLRILMVHTGNSEANPDAGKAEFNLNCCWMSDLERTARTPIWSKPSRQSRKLVCWMKKEITIYAPMSVKGLEQFPAQSWQKTSSICACSSSYVLIHLISPAHTNPHLSFSLSSGRYSRLDLSVPGHISGMGLRWKWSSSHWFIWLW